MKKKIMACLLGLGLLTAPMQASAAVSGEVAYDIDFKGFLILNYYDEQHLVINAMESEISEGTGGTWTMDWGGTAVGGNQLSTTLQDPTSGAIPQSVTITLPNVWALRGLTASGTAKVSIDFNPTGTSQDLVKGTTGSKVTASNLKVSQGGVTAANNITIPVAGLLADKAKFGNVVMDLDISGLTQAGLHSGGKFTITAEAI